MARSEAASGRASRARTSTASAAAGGQAIQAEAWLAWLLAASVAVFLTSNPLYLATACLAGLVVYESLPGGRRRRAYGLIVKIGLFFALLSIPFNVLTGSTGSTGIIELPQLSFPGWLGGVTVGGEVTVEASLYAAIRALRLVGLLLFAVAFNVGVDHYRLLRLVPPALKQLGVVATVAVLLLPQALSQGRAVAEAQRLRGRRMRGLRDAGAFVVPVLAGALERAIARAESLDARGFGSMPSSERGGIRARALVFLSIALASGGVALYFYGDGSLPALGAVAAAGVVAIVAVRLRGRGVEVTRYSHEPLTVPSALVIGFAALSLMLLVAMRVIGAAGIDYYPYPTARVPALSPPALMALLLFLAPVPLVSSGDFEEAGDD